MIEALAKRYLEHSRVERYQGSDDPADAERLRDEIAREDRIRLRAIDAKDLTALLAWVNSRPELPEGPWCKDFSTFKLVGRGAIPSSPSKKTSRVGQII